MNKSNCDLDTATNSMRRSASRLLDSNVYGYPACDRSGGDIYCKHILCVLECPKYAGWLRSFTEDASALQNDIEAYQHALVNRFGSKC